MNLDPGTTLFMGFAVPVAMFLLNQIFNRGDKSEDKTAAVAKQVAELALQISSLRTELAQQALAQHQQMDNRYVLRTEFSREQAMWDFTKELTKAVHRRMHPDASFHEPGAHAG